MKDLKIEQKRSLSRREAADQLTALAAALRKAGTPNWSSARER